MTPSPTRNSSARRRRGGRRGSSAGRPRAPRTSNAEPLHPTADPPDIESFREWDLGDEIQDAIAAMNIVTPTPIQALAIGPVLEGRDIIAKAETGTGKTLAFGAPMLARIDPGRRTVLALVLSPTRELSEQVHGVLEVLGAARGVKTTLIVGGEPMKPQVDALQQGAQVVVGTPGRVLDLMKQGFLSFPWTEYIVLDEADKMLEIGFIDDVKAILAAANDERQTLLFSATFPPVLLELARDATKNPAEVATSLGVSTVDTIEQFKLEVDEEESAFALLRMLDASAKDDIFLVFCDRRTDVDRLLRRVERGRHPVKALHGGYDQASRFRVMTAFRTGDVKLLIATDVASRGLDVLHVTHVVNFGVPRDPSDYTHRIGRTGRAGRAGTAVTFVTPANRRRWQALARALPFDITEIRAPRDLFRRKGDEAPAADSRRGGRDDRPRPDRGASDGERGERPRRRRSRSGGRDEGRDEGLARRREEEPREPREPRAARSENARPERQPRREREDRPERKPRAERERRPDREPRGQRERRPDRGPGPERTPRPEQEPRADERSPERPARSERPEPPTPATPGGFGAGITEERSGGPRKRGGQRRAKADERPSEPKPPAAPEPRRDDGPPGFGAGI